MAPSQCRAGRYHRGGLPSDGRCYTGAAAITELGTSSVAKSPSVSQLVDNAAVQLGTLPELFSS